MKQLSQVLDGVWYTLDEMWLLFEIATETVGSQYLQGAEEYEVTQLAKEILVCIWRGRLYILPTVRCAGFREI